MKVTRQWLPHPFLSLLLWAIWLLLNNTLAMGHVVLGAVLAGLIPFFTQGFWPDRLYVSKPLLLLTLLGRLLADIVSANVQVARWVLTRVNRLQPAFVELELEIQSPFGIAILASLISITPGTVSCDLSADQRYLLIHVLHLRDSAKLIQTIKQRYEYLLMEILKPC